MAVQLKAPAPKNAPKAESSSSLPRTYRTKRISSGFSDSALRHRNPTRAGCNEGICSSISWRPTVLRTLPTVGRHQNRECRAEGERCGRDGAEGSPRQAAHCGSRGGCPRSRHGDSQFGRAAPISPSLDKVPCDRWELRRRDARSYGAFSGRCAVPSFAEEAPALRRAPTHPASIGYVGSSVV